MSQESRYLLGFGITGHGHGWRDRLGGFEIVALFEPGVAGY
jgi:hypothetical protein